METHDFSDAKVGDLVSNPTYGHGKITQIADGDRPIRIDFRGPILFFTIDGRARSNTPQSLYHDKVDFKIEVIEPCPYYVGEEIAVSTSDGWIIRTFVEMHNDVIVDEFGDKWAKHRSLSSFNTDKK